MSVKPKIAEKETVTPGQKLESFLIGTTISYEDMLGIMQTVKVHSTPEDYKKLAGMFKSEYEEVA